MSPRRTARFRRTERHLLGSRRPGSEAQSVRGQAVALDGFRWLGDRFLDASAEGVLLACDTRVELGEAVVVSFPVPGSDLVFDAEAEVVRIVRGEREGDPGYCAGLRFTAFDRRDRLALGVDLRSLPLVPRQLRWDAPKPIPLARPASPSVVVVRPVRVVGAPLCAPSAQA
jgi:hypothetical protein